MESHRCGALRKMQKGKALYCRKRVKEKGELCHIHKKDPKTRFQQSTLQNRIFKLPGKLNINLYYSRTLVIDELLASHLRKRPSKNDKRGWIYIYQIKGDASEKYHKIGRSIHLNPDDRLDDWSKYAVLIAAYRVPCDKWTERLIQLVFDAVRLLRYEYHRNKDSPEQFISLWKSPEGKRKAKDLVEDNLIQKVRDSKGDLLDMVQFPDEIQKQLWKGPDNPLKMGRKKKQTEWFCFQQQMLLQDVESIIQAVADWTGTRVYKISNIHPRS